MTKINHNKHNLEIGQTVWLDEDYSTKCKVEILAFTPNKLFVTVCPIGRKDESWQTMTGRLSRIY